MLYYLKVLDLNTSMCQKYYLENIYYFVVVFGFLFEDDKNY
ncbi:unnamed protein product [Schistosoma margrebowiei]|uniref:Uncharacterized protein n=1 Tax=Schistosoma margrebowiei TaxID=48269 RepID=A0A183N6X6_9TREM|nr:unnamed protein product [Schistosoma margrebowiei]